MSFFKNRPDSHRVLAALALPFFFILTVNASLARPIPLESSNSFPPREKPVEAPPQETSPPGNDDETPLDTLEMTQKLARFRDSFTRFFKEMARSLGTLLFPKGESTSGTQGVSGGSGGAGPAGAFRAMSNPLFSEFDHDPAHGHEHEPFRPLDSRNLKPLLFEESLEKLIPASYAFDFMTSTFLSASVSPVFPFAHFSLSLGETLKAIPSLNAVSQDLSSFPVLTDSVKLPPQDVADPPRFLAGETPLLYSDWKRQTQKPFAFPEPDAIQAPEIPQESLSSPSPGQVTPISLSKPVSPKKDRAPSDLHSPKSSSHTPLIWGAFGSRHERGEKEKKKKRQRTG